MISNANKLIIWILLFSCCWGLLTPQFVLLPVILALFYMMKTILERQSGMFKKHLIAYFIFFIISGFSSLYYEQQSLFKTFSSIACLQFFTILSYFVFLSGKYSIKDIEKAMVIAYVIFLCCFTIQLISPDEIFNLATDYMDIGRFTMYGQLIAYICLFYFYGKYLFSGKTKYLLYILPAFFVLFIAGFRTQIAAILLALGLFTYSVKKIASVKYMLLFLIVIGVLSQTSVVQNSINNMMKRQEAGDTFANEDYIRVIQFNYFTKEHFKSPVEYILGSGIPNPRTKYGQPFYTVDPTLGPYNGWQDWGIVGLSWMIGIPAVLALLFPVLRIIRRKCDDKILFLKFFYIFLLLSSFTTIEFYRVGSFFFHGLLFYLYELYHRHSKHDNIGHTQKVLGQTRRVVNS